MPVRLYGATSGYVDIAVPDVADNSTLTLSPGRVSPGMVLITKQSFSGVTVANIDGVFTSTYKNYRIVVRGACAASPTTETLLMRMRAAGVTNSGATEYGYGASYTQNSTQARLFGNSGDSGMAIGWMGNVAFQTDVTVTSPALAAPTLASGTGYTRYDTTDTVIYVGGVHHTATAYDGFALVGVTGTTFTCDVYVYGYAETVGDYPQLNQVPGLSLITTQTFSAASSVSVNNCFSSTYTNYLASLEISSSSAADADITLRLRAGGVDDSSSVYNGDRIVQFGGTLVGQDYAGGSAFGFSQTASSRPWACSELVLFRPAVADETVILSRSYGAASAGEFYHDLRACAHTSATAFDGLTVYPSSGTFTGTLCIYGYRKA